ncbi:MAG: hypothetical protein LC798_05275 [Chloroflexi bacterium]|nr:hypothetical protein [Chloroflexota bacterium]
MTLRSMWKSITPAVLGVVAIVAEWIASGVLDADAARIALATVFTSFFVWLVPNDPPVTAAPPTIRGSM